MARSPRRISGTGVYHVVIRGNNKEDIFKANQEKNYFLKLMKEAQEKNSVRLYAYCIMSNHVHIMLHAEPDNLAEYMRNLNTKYAAYYNKKFDRCGHVFQGRYYSDCIESEEYYWCCLRYIHNNPVKIHLVSNPEQYQYSSAREYRVWYNSKKSEMIDSSAFTMLTTRFQTPKQFWEFHKLMEYHSFKGTVEEEKNSKVERIAIILEQFLNSRNIKNPEIILTVGDYKKEFIKTCHEKTGISRNNIENILKTMAKGDRHFLSNSHDTD